MESAGKPPLLIVRVETIPRALLIVNVKGKLVAISTHLTRKLPVESKQSGFVTDTTVAFRALQSGGVMVKLQKSAQAVLRLPL